MLTDNSLTVKEALRFLRLNGVDYSEPYFRSLLGLRIVKSEKVFSSRVVPRSELQRIIQRKKK